MKTITGALALTAALLCNGALADTLELADGTLLEGDFVGSSNGIIMFNTGAGIEAFPESEVVGIFMSSGVETRQQEMEEMVPPPQPQPAAAPPPPPKPKTVTVPAGTRLVIRTSDTVDSRRHSAGHRFRGQLESAISVDGNRVLPRGTFVHGRVTQASSGGRAIGNCWYSAIGNKEAFAIAHSRSPANIEIENKRDNNKKCCPGFYGHNMFFKSIL